MKIGILGGLTPQATMVYYKLIISRYQGLMDSENFPEMIIESVNVSKVHHLTMNKNYAELIRYLGNAVSNLSKSGAEVILIASNTPHLFYDEMKEFVSVPIISIVEETYREVIKSKRKRIGLLGTIPTMQSELYKKPFFHDEVEIFIPEFEHQEFLQEKIFRAFSKGIFLKEDIDVIKVMIDDLKRENGINGLILGCTELPIFLKQDEWEDILLFDTTAIHVNGLIRFLIANKR